MNKDASTISRSISSLETRIGLILCERSRQGFRLTKEGEVLVEETIKLFSSCRTFEHRVGSMGGNSSKKLSIGIIDNIITDDNCLLNKHIKEISEFYNDAIQGYCQLIQVG